MKNYKVEDMYCSVNEFNKRTNNLLEEIEKILKQGKSSFSIIKSRLLQKGIIFSDNDLFLAINILITNKRKVIRHDFWNKEPLYELLDTPFKYYPSSNYQNTHCNFSFQDDNSNDNIMLYIADTHQGDETSNPKLIYNLYNYGIGKSATICHHLGDLFKGKIYQAPNPKEEFDRQVLEFINNYPHPYSNQMKTYCTIGNRERELNKYLFERSIDSISHLQRLSIYDPSFHMFPRTSWSTTLKNRSFHFSHKLFLNGMVNEYPIESIEDINFIEPYIDGEYDVSISGHIHEGFIYTFPDIKEDKLDLCISVPSTSNINIGKVVAYLIYLSKDGNSMEISILSCDNNLNIFESDSINWNFNGPNKPLRKVL